MKELFPRIRIFVKGVLRRVKKRLSFSKREQCVVATIVCTSILLLTQNVASDYRYVFVLFLSFCTAVSAILCLREDLKGIEWLTLLILPTFYSAAVAMFYFLLPVRWLTRIPVAILYAVGLYAVLLTENIYNVAANRTIALLRAAHSVGFLITFVTYFLSLQIVFAFTFDPFLNTLCVALLSFLFVFQSLWSMELETKASRRVWIISIILTIVLLEMTWIVSFWPVASMMRALFIASIYYSLVGMSQQYVVEKMYKKTVMEFMIVCVVVAVIFFLTTQFRTG